MLIQRNIRHPELMYTIAAPSDGVSASQPAKSSRTKFVSYFSVTVILIVKVIVLYAMFIL